MAPTEPQLPAVAPEAGVGGVVGQLRTEPSYVDRSSWSSSPVVSRTNCSPSRFGPSVTKVMSCQSQCSAPWNDRIFGVGTRAPESLVQTPMPRASVTPAGSSKGSHCAHDSIPQPSPSFQSRMPSAAMNAILVRSSTS